MISRSQLAQHALNRTDRLSRVKSPIPTRKRLTGVPTPQPKARRASPPSN